MPSLKNRISHKSGDKFKIDWFENDYGFEWAKTQEMKDGDKVYHNFALLKINEHASAIGDTILIDANINKVENILEGYTYAKDGIEEMFSEINSYLSDLNPEQTIAIREIAESLSNWIRSQLETKLICLDSDIKRGRNEHVSD